MISIIKTTLFLAVTIFTFNQCVGESNYYGSSVSWRTLDHSNNDQIVVRALFIKVFRYNCKDPGSWLCYEHSGGSTCGTLYNSSWECTDTFDRLSFYFYTSTSIVKFQQTTDDVITYRQTSDVWHRISYKTPTASSIPFHVNLTRRTDTANPNSSPVAFMPSFTKLYAGCEYALHIPTFDEDGDDVTCRFGENTFENGDVVNDYPYFTLDEDNCVLRYNGGGSRHTDVAVTIIVEDHSTSDPAITYSYVPLQFIIFAVYEPGFSSYCGKNPVIESPTHMEKFTVNSEEEFHLVVQARKHADTRSISRIQINGAAHMTANSSSPVGIGGNLYQTSYTWIPTADDKGQNFICFTAYEPNANLQSEQRCVIIDVEGRIGNSLVTDSPSVTAGPTCYSNHSHPSNGTVNCTNTNLLNSTCSFTCNNGYELSGDPVSQCEIDGWSTPAPICMLRPKCDSHHSNPSNGIVNCTNTNLLNSICTFTCNNGYELSGDPVSQCEIDGWSTPAPNCIRTCDPQYSDPSNGKVNCTNSNVWNSTCTFTCNYSYELVGEPVSQCGFDGWSTNASSCQAISCDRLFDPSNGEVNCTNSNIFDSSCTFACNYGYELTGEAVLQCGFHEWSSPAPNCTLITTCDPHNDPTDGDVSCSRSNLLNSTCTFSCNYAHELIGDPVSQCGAGGWNTSAPSCQNGCEVQGTSCSDTCDELSDSEYTCSCDRSCWELASNQAACIPKIETTCTKDRVQVNVEKCAVDGDIMLGDYDSDRILPSQCLPTQSSDFYHFDIPLGECQSAVIDTAGGKRQSVLVKVWVEDPQKDLTNDSSPLARGSWYKVQVNCETETAFDVSNSFDPDDSATSLVTEIGFGPIQFSFDFYRNLTFQAIYEIDEYPIGYGVRDDIYFGISAQTNKSDVELFTKSCQAVADPNPQSITHVALINNGCLMDETMRDYPASDPLRNHFSIEAFRFKTSLPGITEATDVRIECRVVVCVQLENVTTTCSEGCVSRSARSRSAGTDFLMVDRDRVAGERVLIVDGGVPKLTSDDQRIIETDSILLKKSGRIHFIEDSQGGGSRTHLHITETVFMALLVALLLLA